MTKDRRLNSHKRTFPISKTRYSRSYIILPQQMVNTPPLRRRYSVTSISPNSSPSHRSPPRKRLESEFKPTFEVKPKNWKDNDDLIFEGLFDNVLHIAFLHDTWSSKFIDLGFSLGVISFLQQALDRLEERYSGGTVWQVLQLETVGNIATMILEAEVMQYSYKFIEYSKKKDEDETDGTESSNEREDTPCPIPSVIVSNSIASGHEDRADVGGGDSMEDERGCGGDPEEDGGNGGMGGDGEEVEDGGDGGMGRDGEDGGKSNNEQDGERENDDEEAPDTAKRSKFLQKTDRLAKDHGITIHFLGHPGITHNPSFMPSLNVLPEPAPESNILFHGSNVINGQAGLFSTLDSFLNYGPIIMRGNSLILKPSYLSTQPAIYYSSSLTYARMWPILKLGLSRYRLINIIPDETSLIAISRVSGAVLNGEISSIMTARISQNNSELAAKFANRNTSQKGSSDRKSIHKDNVSTADADIIMSPLPRLELLNLAKCKVGNAINLMTPIKSITIVAGCTIMGARCLGSGVKEYIVYGFGIGRLGTGADEGDWGTAFMEDKTHNVNSEFQGQEGVFVDETDSFEGVEQSHDGIPLGL